MARDLVIMTPDERRQFNEILSHGSMLNVSEKFLLDLVVKLEVELNQAFQALDAKLYGAQEAQHKYSIEQQRNHKAMAALRTVLARVRYSDIASDWKAPIPGRDDGLRNKRDDLADKAQYPGRLEDWLEQTIAGLE
jgi:hypothetical protein